MSKFRERRNAEIFKGGINMALFGEVKEFEPVDITMSDGANLKGNLHLPDYPPDGLGPYPTLVRMTPYPRSRPGLHSEIQYAVSHGYAVVIVSQRGRFGSDRDLEGERGSKTAADGHDTIEWAATQDWSTGKVGTFGISSDGQWQLFAGTQQPPHLKAMFVSYPANSRDGRIDNGVYTSTGVGWHAVNDAFARGLWTLDDWHQWLDDWRKSELPMLTSFINPDLMAQFVHNPDDNYWSTSDPSVAFDKIQAPVLLECGWYDRYVRWVLQAFAELRAKSEVNCRSHHQLLMGPWTHGGVVPIAPEPATFPEQARINRRAAHIRWFDRWLKDEDNGVDDEAPARVYIMGGNRWAEGDVWPLSQGQTAVYYLRSGSEDGGASLNEGLLALEAPKEEEEGDTFENNPYDPVPSIGGHGGVGRWWKGGPLDQRPAEARSLTYTTAKLKKNLSIVGEVRARIHATSTAVDTDFVLTISDVYPDGYSAILRQTPMRARYRNGKDELLVPGEPFEFEIVFPAIANVFKEGHRLRIAVASTSFPAFLPNPGTSEQSYMAAKATTSQNTILHGPAHPSHLELPLLE